VLLLYSSFSLLLILIYDEGWSAILQDPAEADKLTKIQRDLDETKIILVSVSDLVFFYMARDLQMYRLLAPYTMMEDQPFLVKIVFMTPSCIGDVTSFFSCMGTTYC
jgi:hypothetical protein